VLCSLVGLCGLYETLFLIPVAFNGTKVAVAGKLVAVY